MAKMPELKVEESKSIDPGAHSGVVERWSYEQRGQQQFPYIDIHVKENETGIVLKAGYAANKVTPTTALGKLLERFGRPLEVGESITEALLNEVIRPGTLVVFQTDQEKTENGTFARLLEGTLKPAPKRR